MAERSSNQNYFAFRKEATKGVVAGSPNTYLPIYANGLMTDAQLQDVNPSAGVPWARFNKIPGQRKHTGEVTTLLEPLTANNLLHMTLPLISETGAGPYTRVFGPSFTISPVSYTVDIGLGNVVARYWGVESSSFAPDIQDNEVRVKLQLAALGSFQGREIATVSTNTITLKTDYDAAPNTGLVTGDLVRIWKQSTGATLDTTITTVNGDGVTIVLGTSAAAFAAGDMIHLRPATVSFGALIQTSYQWANTRFKFGATAAAAVSAAQTRVEKGSIYEVMNPFEKDGGSDRSGGYDPAALPRTNQYDASLTIKKFFDTPENVRDFNNGAKNAIVVEHLAGTSLQHILRMTLNNIRTDQPMPKWDSTSINYAEIPYWPIWDLTDSAAMSFTTITTLPTPL